MIFRNDKQRKAVFSRLNNFSDRFNFVGVMSKKDHLAEIPDYYDRLEKLEEGAKEDGVFIDVEASKKSGEFSLSSDKSEDDDKKRGLYKVMSSAKSHEFWVPERTYTLKSYAEDVAKSIEDGGRRAKIIEL